MRAPLSSRARVVLAAALATVPLLALGGYAAYDRYKDDRTRATTRATTRAELYAALLAERGNATTMPTRAELDRLVRLSPLGEGTAVEVYDGSGRLVIRAGSVRAHPADDDRLVSTLEDGSGTVDADGADGTERVWAVATVQGSQIRVAYGLRGSEVYGAAFSALRRDAILAAIATALAIAAAFAVAGHATAPIRRLAARVGHEGTSRGDLGALERGIERMDSTIQESQVELERRAERLEQAYEERNRAYAELQQLNHELEERVIQRTAELEDANRELEAFSYSVSHDLRAPLRAIDGFSGLVIDDYADVLPPDGLRYLGLVRENTQNMGKLIDGLLAFSRLGQQQLDRHRLDVKALVDDVVGDVSAHENGRALEFSIGKLPEARADPTLLRQVFVNLLSNSVKFTSEQSEARIEVGSHHENGTPVYFVRDNGMGFDMRYAGKLFQVFQRLHPAGGPEGTGLGLALVERIVKRHGGRIWADAKPGEGATFSFTLGGEES
jgi:signal transduction histidine kinase